MVKRDYLHKALAVENVYVYIFYFVYLCYYVFPMALHNIYMFHILMP